jgi:hypothetical protein
MTTVSARYFGRISTETVDIFSQKSPISNSTEIRPMGATMIRRTDGQTEMSKLLTVAVCDHEVLVGKPEGDRPFGRPRRRWEDNIKMNFQEVGRGGMEWIILAHDRYAWRALVNAVMNLRVP